MADFIVHYGFNTMDPSGRCLARYIAGSRGVAVEDHGCVSVMFFGPTDWNDGTMQSWRADPVTAGPGDLSTDVAEAHTASRSVRYIQRGVKEVSLNGGTRQ
jgi:hypothetical protein